MKTITRVCATKLSNFMLICVKTEYFISFIDWLRKYCHNFFCIRPGASPARSNVTFNVFFYFYQRFGSFDFAINFSIENLSFGDYRVLKNLESKLQKANVWVGANILAIFYNMEITPRLLCCSSSAHVMGMRVQTHLLQRTSSYWANRNRILHERGTRPETRLSR